MNSPLDTLARHPRRTAAATWISLFVLAGLANVLVKWAAALKEAGDFTLWPVVVDQSSSIGISLLLLPCLLAACSRWPMTLANWRYRLPVYVFGSVAWTLLHVAGMVTLRKFIHHAAGGQYDYSPWIANLIHEYGKDVQTFFLIVAITHSFEWYARLRQGEAHVLSEPDAGIAPVPETAQPERPERFLVRKLGREFLIATNDIEWLQANGNYVNLHLAGRAYPLRSTIASIESQLDPDVFFRVHRSHIVNLRFVASIEPTDPGDARIHMKDGTQVACSRRYREALRLGLT